MIEKDNQNEKKVYTDAERLALAEKLDKELDDFMNSLDKKSYTEGWPEDRWQEEMEKHPFFMSKTPDDPTEVSPLIEGLQQLKYSEEFNTPNELAQSYKEDGNFNYKHKKYRLAVLSYSKGISSKCQDLDLMAQLYNNRSLAQFKLQNYRSSLNDCKLALKLKSDYLKPLLTAAKCCIHVKNYDECVKFCDEIIAKPDWEKKFDEDVEKLKTDALKSKKIALRDSRLQERREKTIEKNREKIIEVIKSRNIKVNDFEKLFVNNVTVRLNDEDLLVWPVFFAYPEHQQTDFIESFNECTLISEQLMEIFQESPSWDREGRYKPEHLNVYFVGSDKKTHKIDKDQPLTNVLRQENFIVTESNVYLFAVVANSIGEEQFLKLYK